MTVVDVIGGSGFIGTRLIKRLKNNAFIDVQIVDKNISKTFPELTKIGDVRKVGELKEKVRSGSVIINLAAEHRDDVSPLNLYFDVNVSGALNICTVAREKGINIIVFTSTVAVYGFAPIGTDEAGNISPFNEYGRTKFEAEKVFQAWQNEAPNKRTLVIIRPTVVFGEQNRGNVYNLLKQIATGKFVMIGNGQNRKSITYVENLAAFIEYVINFKPGYYIYNFIDKPDYTMNTLISDVYRILGRSERLSFSIPFSVGYLIGKMFDFAAALTGKQFAISSIRVKKFCADSVYNTSTEKTGFIAPVSLETAIEKTVCYEFIENNDSKQVFYTE